MKRIFAVFAVLAVCTLGFMGCPDAAGSDENSNTDVIGTWKGTGAGGNMTLEIGENTFTLVYGAYNKTGQWTRQGTILTLGYMGTATLPSGRLELELVITDAGSSVEGTYHLTKNGSPGGTVPATTLTIKNESSIELTEVIWGGVSFGTISTGGVSVTKNVGSETGYLYCKPKNSISVYIQDPITTETGKTKDITITNNTVIVDINNTDNAGRLGSLTSSVVFFDDAEGEMQQYATRQDFVGYYKTKSDITPPSDYHTFYTPKNGKSIAVGGTNTAKLHLTVDLAKPAKLSFWVANKPDPQAANGAIFSINGTEQETWKTDMDWSFKTFTLSAGQNDIVWEKKDGSRYNSYGNYSYFYLSLDDILIYYTE